MTWTKLGAEFCDQLAEVDLTDAEFRTHVEAIAWLYSIDRRKVTDTTIPKRLLRKIATTDDPDAAAEGLAGKGVWADAGENWRVKHHADVIAQSLAAQRNKRERDRQAQRKHRQNHGHTPENVSDDISADISADVAATQTDSQPSTYEEPENERWVWPNEAS